MSTNVFKGSDLEYTFRACHNVSCHRQRRRAHYPTSRKSVRSRSLSAFLRSAHASSGTLSGISFRSNLRFSLQSRVLCPVVFKICYSHSDKKKSTALPFVHTFLSTIPADVCRFLWTLRCEMSLLIADTTAALEDTRLGALGLGVTTLCLASVRLINQRTTYPSSPQLKHAPPPRRGWGHSREK